MASGQQKQRGDVRFVLPILAGALFTASLASAQPVPLPTALPPIPSKPLSVSSPSTFASALPDVPRPSASRLSDVAPDRLSPLCRTAALKHLQHHRRKTSPSDADRQELDDFRAMHLDCFNATGASVTSGSTGVGEEVLRSVAQVVLKRAQRAAWRVLQDKLLDQAGCNDAKTNRFPSTCKTLGSLSIADLTTSPAVLLDGLVADFLPMALPAENRPWIRVPLLEESLRESAARWPLGGSAGMQSGLAQIVRRRLKEQVQKPECALATAAFDKALWVSGMCMIEAQAPANFSKCDVDGWASQCTDPITTARILRIWSVMTKVLGTSGKTTLADYADLMCTSADITIDEMPDLTAAQRQEGHDYVAAMHAFLGGLGHKDWIETTSGAVRVLGLVTASAGCDGAPNSVTCKRNKAAQNLFTLLAAVGNYAETFRDGSSDPSAAREKILEDLADRMVSRTHRDTGWVVSAGGQVGLLGGVRTDFLKGRQVAFPAQLGLGLGVQSYHAGNYGFHGAATAIDLGQYITFSSSSLTVASPSIESAVALGLTLGAWVGMRETPLYIGAYGGVSPFVQVGGKPTFQVGLTTGIYVPLLDFN